MKKRLLCALGAAAIMATAVPTAFAAAIPQALTDVYKRPRRSSCPHGRKPAKMQTAWS